MREHGSTHNPALQSLSIEQSVFIVHDTDSSFVITSPLHTELQSIVTAFFARLQALHSIALAQGQHSSLTPTISSTHIGKQRMNASSQSKTQVTTEASNSAAHMTNCLNEQS